MNGRRQSFKGAKGRDKSLFSGHYLHSGVPQLDRSDRGDLDLNPCQLYVYMAKLKLQDPKCCFL
jgi:hypothetical protein